MDDPDGSFYILTSGKFRWMDGEHVVFGKVLEGMNVVRKIASTRTRHGDAPEKEVKIVHSRELPVDAPFETEMKDVD